MLVYLKSGDKYKHEDMSRKELDMWFEENTDQDGNVQKEIVLFNEVFFKAAEDDTFDFVMSDYSLDRDLERIDPTGWDLKNFKKNPVVLWSHDGWSPAIGKVIMTKADEKALSGKIKMDANGKDQFAAMIADKMKNGFITAGSVGFRSLQIEWIEDDKAPERLIHRKQELYEFSIVNIPANPKATMQRNAEIDELKMLLEDQKNEIEALKNKSKHSEEKQTNYIDYLFAKDETSPNDETSHESKNDNKFGKFFNGGK